MTSKRKTHSSSKLNLLRRRQLAPTPALFGTTRLHYGPTLAQCGTQIRLQHGTRTRTRTRAHHKRLGLTSTQIMPGPILLRPGRLTSLLLPRLGVPLLLSRPGTPLPLSRPGTSILMLLPLPGRTWPSSRLLRLPTPGLLVQQRFAVTPSKHRLYAVVVCCESCTPGSCSYPAPSPRRRIALALLQRKWIYSSRIARADTGCLC